MPRIAIILGSTRPGRNGAQVADWVVQQSDSRNDATYSLVDLAEFPLPHLDEPLPPSWGRYEHDHTRSWSAEIARHDGYIFVTPEYNHSIPGALKNALDYLYAEWINKAAGFVGYGSQGAVRAVEHLRLTMIELGVANVRQQVALSLAADFHDYHTFAPRPAHGESLHTMIDQVVAWSDALAPLRDNTSA